MRKSILTLMVAMAFVLGATAQDRVITGRVTNDKSAPMEAVSVTTPDGKSGTQTDKNGSFSLTVSSSVRSLVFSFVNFETVTKAIGKSDVINVTLVSSDTKLEEVVIVGYGVQQKKAFTGSASKIDTKQFAQLVTPSIDKQLAGRAAGVNVNNSSGLVNAPARIRIRGTNSFSNDRSPLIIVDGVPITTGNLAQVGNSNAIGDINPADIETIDVLKDGSATAIYGSRAANGIIVITTKKGTRGRTAINYDGTFGFSSPMQKFDVLNAAQFVEIANEKFVNAGQLPQARLDSAGTNTDWQKNVFVNNGFSQSHTLSISGGNDRSTFYMSLNYSDQQGIIRTNKNTSYRIRTNIEHRANNWLKVGNNLTVTRQNDFDQLGGFGAGQNVNGLSNAIVAALRDLPNVAIYSKTHPTGYNILPGGNALGQGANLRSIDDNYTNIAFILDKNRFQSDKYRIIDVAFIEISPVKGLKIHSQIAGDYFTDNSTNLLDPRHGDGFSSNGIALQAQQNILNTDIQNYINYNLSLKGHNMYFTAGHEIQQTKTRFFQAQGTNLVDLYFIKDNIVTNALNTPSIFGNVTDAALVSYFGRFNYDYKGKYFAQASIRTDGQSSLAGDKRWGQFPGFSVGWSPTQEKFWQNSANLRKISDFKIKASYAVVGNRLSGFPYLSTYGISPYGNIGGISVAQIGNPELQWEQSKKFDIGLELGLFKNRVNLTVDYFKSVLDKLVIFIPTPYSAGVPGNTIPLNTAKVVNNGIELSLDATVARCKNFQWDMNVNYTHVKNEIKSLYTFGNIPTTKIYPSNYNINKVGESINAIFGYDFAGVNAGNGNPVYYNANGRLVQRNIQNGSYYFANSMSDPTLGAPTTLTVADKKVLGSAQPTYYGAFTNTFNYKNISLEVMFRYGGGNKIVNITRQEVLLNQKFANNGTEILNRWTTPGQITDVPKLWYNLEASINQNGETISRFVEKGDFLRLQNIVLSYAFDAKKLQDRTNNVIRSARVFIQAQNVHVWTKYKGIDPEAYSEGGLDNTTAPQVRTISAGVSIGL